MRDLTLATPPSPCLECSSRSRSRRWRWSWSCRTGGRAIRATAARSLSDSRIRTCSPSGIDRRLLLIDSLTRTHVSRALTRRERQFARTYRFLAARAQTQDGEVVVGWRRRGTAAGVDFLLNARSFATIFHHRHLKSEESRPLSQICTPGTEFIQKLGRLFAERASECEIYGNSRPLNVETFQAFFQRILCHICLDAHKFPASFGFLSISLRFCFLCKFLINAIHRNDPPALRALVARRICVSGQRARPALCIPDPASIDYHQFPW